MVTLWRQAFVRPVCIPAHNVCRAQTAVTAPRVLSFRMASVVQHVPMGKRKHQLKIYFIYKLYIYFFRISCSYYSDRGICAKCYLSCHTCSGPRRNQCVQCPAGWQLAAGECHPECPEGFYKSDFGCQKCHHYCKTCNGECMRQHELELA